MEFTHLNEEGRGRMVDLRDKKESHRRAVAQGTIHGRKETMERIRQGRIEKGDVLAVAQLAGISAAKKTSELILLCHNIPLRGVDLSFDVQETSVQVTSEVSTYGPTGVEMEALTAVCAALLSIYDMCKAVDKAMVLGEIHLLSKEGGKSGPFFFPEAMERSLSSSQGPTTGTVVSVNFSQAKGTVKEPVAKGLFLEGVGLEGDAHAGNWHRMVSLLAIESYAKRAQTKDLPIGSFAENLTTQGLVLHTLPVGTLLEIGETLQEVTQIGKECHKGCEIRSLVGDCVMPREGIFTRVRRGGTIHPGDAIRVFLPQS
ncbi:Molybdenum cofactor biosynthesis protein MoaC [Clostridiaceae bacterium JG1575]|nr:Molybdenum cofactor biosynthesis protein MoaC [Clostridiaceae bacterium JG1575]